MVDFFYFAIIVVMTFSCIYFFMNGELFISIVMFSFLSLMCFYFFSDEDVAVVNNAEDVAIVNNTELIDSGWLSGELINKELIGDPYAKNYYFVLDGSASMMSAMGACNKENEALKINIMKESISDVVNYLGEDVNIGLLAFDSKGVEERVSLGKNNTYNIVKEINNIEAKASTPLKTSINKAYESLKKQAILQGGYGEYNLIIVTDGDANLNEEPKEIVAEIVKDSPVNIYAVGMCVSDNHALNSENAYFINASDREGMFFWLKNVLK